MTRNCAIFSLDRERLEDCILEFKPQVLFVLMLLIFIADFRLRGAGGKNLSEGFSLATGAGSEDQIKLFVTTNLTFATVAIEF